MKLMDCVEVIVEKGTYARAGVHKGMQGWICDDRCIQSYWLVNFPQCEEKGDIATIGIKEEDLILLPDGMDAQVNERVKAQFDSLAQKTTSISDEDNSCYLG